MKFTHKILFMLLTATIICGCRRVENVVYSEFIDIPANGWDPTITYGFCPWPMDSVIDPANNYSLVICVRHAAKVNVAPLHIIVRHESLSEHCSADTLKITLQPPINKPGGRGAYGIYETHDTILHNFSLHKDFFVELQSLSEMNATKGIRNIGLKLISNDNR